MPRTTLQIWQVRIRRGYRYRWERREFRIDGINGESIVVDGDWVEKQVDALIAELDKARDRAST